MNLGEWWVGREREVFRPQRPGNNDA